MRLGAASALAPIPHVTLPGVVMRCHCCALRPLSYRSVSNCSMRSITNRQALYCVENALSSPISRFVACTQPLDWCAVPLDAGRPNVHASRRRSRFARETPDRCSVFPVNAVLCSTALTIHISAISSRTACSARDCCRRNTGTYWASKKNVCTL